MLKRIGGAIAVVCVSLGGCMGLQPTAYSSLSATEAAAESEMWESEVTPSFRSGAPRRTSQPRLAKSAPSEEQTRATSVKVASAARSVSDATPSPDVVPGDRSVLLLPSNRERFLKEGLTEADRKGAHIVRSICSGC